MKNERTILDLRNEIDDGTFNLIVGCAVTIAITKCENNEI